MGLEKPGGAEQYFLPCSDALLASLAHPPLGLTKVELKVSDSENL